VGDYSIEVKPSARKELEALPDYIPAHVLEKVETLG
jgi:mRNA-degrading endonuclease RelE of RelBE toxin-antitoxin system